MRGERFRFWFPVVILAGMTGYAGQKLVRAHVDPDVDLPDYVFERSVSARRGSIYASGGKNTPLAKSVPYWEYHLDPVSMTNRVVKPKGEPPRSKAAIVKTIANALHLDYAKVKAMAGNDRKRYQPLGMSYDSEAHDILANSKLVAGVAIDDRQVREYMLGHSMSHVLGSVNAEGVGSCGLELRFNRELAGTPGIVRGVRDGHGRELYDKRIISLPPKPGVDLYLTVDTDIQFEAEEALRWGLREYGASTGWAIVMDASTGAVRAMASYPDFRPDQFGKADESAKLNRAIGFVFEPGSVMKVLTVATAIETNPRQYGPNTVYNTSRNDSRYYKLPGDGSHRWDPTMTLEHAIVHSSNIVIGKLAYDLGPKTLFNSFRKFGLGQRTGIELPGEEFGILPDPRKKMWDLASRSRAGIGQFIALTPIQLISAYQAIANDGVRMRPHVIDRIVAADGSEVYKSAPAELSRPISAKTAKTVRKMMLGVAAKGGTAWRAAIRGYSVAGKTGTAQKAKNGHYITGLYRASFCGMIPAADPQIVILVSLDFEAITKFHQGGNSAGPVFKRIALAAIRYLGIPPDRPEELEEYETDDEFDKILDARASRYEPEDIDYNDND